MAGTRLLTAAGALLLFGAGFLLWPTAPTRAQEPGQRPGREKLGEVKKLLDQVKKLEAALHTQQQALEEQRMVLEQKANQLHKALKALEADRSKPVQPGERLGPRQAPLQPGGLKGIVVPPRVRPDVERRLGELEKNLAAALHEVQELRKDMAKRPPGFGPGGGLRVPGQPGQPPRFAPRLPGAIAPPGAPPAVEEPPTPPATTTPIPRP